MMISAMKLLSIVILVLVISIAFGSTLVFTDDCTTVGTQYTKSGSSIATCVPSYCNSQATIVTNSQAVDSKAGQTIANSYITTQITDLGCKQCTQSTDDMCSSSSLSSVIKTGYGLKAAYCNDNYLVTFGTGEANHPDGLADIPRPPGDGIGSVYSNQGVTRTYHEEFAVYKIPLSSKRTYRDSTFGTADANYIAMAGQTDPARYSTSSSPAAVADYGLPTSGAVGITVSGQQVFPLFNNVGRSSMDACEVDRCNAHAGQGFDYHYHGDPFSNTAGRCMYSPADYSNTDTGHPPQIGWSLDGYLMYGRHLSANNIGYLISLDNCGGHSHGSYGYHYHAQVIVGSGSGALGVGSGVSYNEYVAGPYQCWGGSIANINFFGNTASFKSRTDYLAGDLTPCCSSTNYYVESGISGSASSGIGYTTTTTTTTTGSTSTTSLSTAALAGIIVGSVVGFVLLVLVVNLSLQKAGYISSSYFSISKSIGQPTPTPTELEMGNHHFQAMSIETRAVKSSSPSAV